MNMRRSPVRPHIKNIYRSNKTKRRYGLALRGLFWSAPLLITLLLTACVQAENSSTGIESPTTGAEPIDSTATISDEEPTSETSTTIDNAVPSPLPSPFKISPTPAETATMTPSPSKDDLSIQASDISLYPLAPIYVGDQVTIRLDPFIPEDLPPNDVDVRIFIDGQQIVSDHVNWRGLDGRAFGLYRWVWNAGDVPGYHTIIVFLDPEDLIRRGDEHPDNNVASVTVAVDRRDTLPEIEANARWISAVNTCCHVRVISGTAAHRDLDRLLDQIDLAFQEASTKLSESFADRYDVYLVDKVFGQGGYAKDAMVVSYLDRDYITGGLDELIVHEAVHLIDRQIASNPITFLSEGLAVWVAGGHYRQQELGQQSAALVEIGRYQALDQVIEDFFGIQHEVGYLEGAGLIDYLVRTYGWEQVKAFYGETSADDGETLSEAVDANVERYFGRSLIQLESEWISYLRDLPRDRSAIDDLRTTLRLYDLVRRYQKIYDPSAYYLTAWLPAPEVAEQIGATADFSRHPDSPINIAMEALLLSAGAALSDGDFDRSSAFQDSVERVLDNNGAFLDPLALSYLNIVITTGEMGYEVQKIDLVGNQATIQGSQPEDPALVQLDLSLSEERHWILVR